MLRHSFSLPQTHHYSKCSILAVLVLLRVFFSPIKTGYQHFKGVEFFCVWILPFLNSHSRKIKTQIQVREQRKYSGPQPRWPGTAPAATLGTEVHFLGSFPWSPAVRSRQILSLAPRSFHVTVHSFYYISSGGPYLVATLQAPGRAGVALEVSCLTWKVPCPSTL